MGRGTYLQLFAKSTVALVVDFRLAWLISFHLPIRKYIKSYLP